MKRVSCLSVDLVRSPEEGFQSLTHSGRVSRREFPVFYLVKSPEDGFKSLTHPGTVS